MLILKERQLREVLSKIIFKTHRCCWEWNGYKTKEGYGRIKMTDFRTMAHIVTYRMFREDIPKGLSIDHLCGNTSCVNPWHMEAVPIEVNVMRGNGACVINA